MAAPKDTTHSISNCYKCGKEFVKPCAECPMKPCQKGKKCNIGKAMNIAPLKDSERKHTFVALCDECYDEQGIWWVGSIPKYKREN